ncbi:MAG: hypothetical protein ACXWG1_05800 [Usitatibacter sp.]
MQHPIIGTEWQKTLWKLIRNPAIEVVAAIVVVLFATWLIVLSDTENRGHSVFPVPYGPHK